MAVKACGRLPHGWACLKQAAGSTQLASVPQAENDGQSQPAPLTSMASNVVYAASDR